jgi:hypothetical protein
MNAVKHNTKGIAKYRYCEIHVTNNGFNLRFRDQTAKEVFPKILDIE